MFKAIKSFIKKTKKTNTVEFWSAFPGIEELDPPRPAGEFIPEWFKKMPRFDSNVNVRNGIPINGAGTVKTCPSFLEYFSTGYVIPMWYDMHVRVGIDENDTTVHWSRWHNTDNKNSWKNDYFSSKIYVDKHADSQYIDCIPEVSRENNITVIKANSPWRFKTPPGYSMLQLPMYYHFHEYFEVIPGVIWTDLYHEINLQIVVKKPGSFIIEKGTPMVVYIPFKRESYKLECLKDSAEIERNDNIMKFLATSKFIKGYREAQKKHSAKCPFAKFS